MKMISESMIFKEDDRRERPFVVLQILEKKVSNIWFTVYDLQ